MPKGGLEPPCPFEHNALNVACLPISPLRRVCCGQALYYCITCGLSSGLKPFSWEDFYLFPRKLYSYLQCRRERLWCLSSIPYLCTIQWLNSQGFIEVDDGVKLLW